MRQLICGFIICCLASTSEARIGDTPIQFADRYGPPKDSAQDKHPSSFSTLVEGAIQHSYEYKGWRIRAAFLQLDGPAVRLDYQKISGAGVNPKIEDYELQAITAANTPAGMTWKRIEVANPNIAATSTPRRIFAKMVSEAVGEKIWQRSDGATLWLRPGGMFVRLELPAAREYEAQLKAAKEKKARESVPKF